MTTPDIDAIAKSLVAPGKGILAADESTGTIKKRLDSIGVESTADSRRAYRELLFTASGLSDHVSGVILYDETIRQKTEGGVPLGNLLSDQGVHPGIKVDTGAKVLASSPEEQVTEGLDGLRERLAEYAGLGAKFTKWRAVLKIAHAKPSPYCLDANTNALARFAALSQEAGLVPIVEPEVLMDGEHSIERCQRKTAKALQALFEALFRHRVRLEGTLLKPNMVISGLACETQADSEEIAARTIETLRRHVPAAVPGIVFLSGGQSEEEATRNLNAINALGPQPWQLSFSYGRALQQSALKAWGGEAANVAAAQAILAHRARMNGASRDGSYKAEMEKAAA
ncbi:MAG: fructose-bisphosphate aldolase class I [Alphaproteobacteria bacterium]|jgi:fructose-bisphosphate aldolase class I|nr:fructose-bisphosphate aldolase class I [Alphaproteobacteria bacterium]HJP21845.1 class I fructose-bisphosphate aldolase [Alphaproteobacteria bacterium]